MAGGRHHASGSAHLTHLRLLDFRDRYAPGAGCSITSTATVSTAGATGCFTRRAAFFTGAGLGLALATVRFVAFADFATLRALPRLAEFPLRSFARFCTFDAFLRLAMIAPLVLANDTSSKSRQASKRKLSTGWACPGQTLSHKLGQVCAEPLRMTQG